MLNRLHRADQAQLSVQHIAHQSATWAVFAKGKVTHVVTYLITHLVRRLVISARHTFVFSGVAAIALVSVIFFKPDVADQIIALSPFTNKTKPAVEADPTPPPTATISRLPAIANTSATGNVALQQDPALKITLLNDTFNHSAKLPSMAAETTLLPATDSQQKRVIYWLSKRYRLAGDAASMLVIHTYQTAKEIKLDPLLILAVMAIESGFNPYAESPVGAQGLMQVMSKIHHEKFQPLGGLKAALNPLANIKVGSLILKEYVNRGGSVEAGLKTYVGAAAFESDAGYGSKVMAEYRRLKEVATGKSVPVFSTTASSVNNGSYKQKPATGALATIETKNEAAVSAEGAPTLPPEEQIAIL